MDASPAFSAAASKTNRVTIRNCIRAHHAIFMYIVDGLRSFLEYDHTDPNAQDLPLAEPKKRVGGLDTLGLVRSVVRIAL